MTADGHSVALLSGEITVEQRIAVLNRFRDGKEKLLITTNVCARGIDVEQVNTCDFIFQLYILVYRCNKVANCPQTFCS